MRKNDSKKKWQKTTKVTITGSFEKNKAISPCLLHKTKIESIQRRYRNWFEEIVMKQMRF